MLISIPRYFLFIINQRFVCTRVQNSTRVRRWSFRNANIRVNVQQVKSIHSSCVNRCAQGLMISCALMVQIP